MFLVMFVAKTTVIIECLTEVSCESCKCSLGSSESLETSKVQLKQHLHPQPLSLWRPLEESFFEDLQVSWWMFLRKFPWQFFRLPCPSVSLSVLRCVHFFLRLLGAALSPPPWRCCVLSSFSIWQEWNKISRLAFFLNQQKGEEGSTTYEEHPHIRRKLAKKQNLVEPTTNTETRVDRHF